MRYDSPSFALSRANKLPFPGDAGVYAHLTKDRHRAFVGRAREFAALTSALEAAHGGRGTLCLISGEPGIGKSRLLNEFTAEHAARGSAIHWGFAWEAGGAPVYWPWIQILRSVLLRDCARTVLRDQPHIAPPLAELVPELLPATARESARLEPEQARFRLMDAVSTLLGACAAQEPLVLVLEDLHAVDTDSLSLLEFAVRQLHGARALVIGTLRDNELHRPRVGNIVARLSRSAIQLPLRRLDRDDVREYLRVATGERPLEQDITRLATLTEGHPLYLAEVVELGIERGNLLNAPASISLTVLERASQLPERTRTLLGMASVLGRGFQTSALADIAQCTEAEVREQLRPALACGLLENDAGTALRFEHMLVREAFHETLDAAERRRLHEREAQRMRARAERGSVISWAALAQHLEESGEHARNDAMRAWREAAHQAEARHSFDDAALCYTRALHLRDEGQPADAAHARLLLELATAQIRAGDLEAGRRNSSEAFRIGETLGDAELIADAALAYGSIFTFGNVDPRLVTQLRTALARLGEGEVARRARLQARLAAAMQPCPNPAEPAALAHQAIELARSANCPRTLLTTLRSAISALMDMGDPVERLALNQEYVRLATQLGDTPECMRGYLRSAVDASELGEAAILDEAIGQCEALADELVLPHYQWTAAAMRSMRALSRGEFAAAEEAWHRARRFADRAQDSNAALTLLVQQFAVAEMRGDLAQLDTLAARVERQSARMPQSDLYIKPVLLAAGVQLGRKPGPADLDEGKLRDVIRFCDMGALSALGDFLPAFGDPALIELAYDSVRPYRDRCGHWGLLGMCWRGPVARSLGLLAAALGRMPAAEEHFHRAVETSRRMDARPWLARSVLDWLESGERNGVRAPAALALLDEALATAKDLGMQGVARSLEKFSAPSGAERTQRTSDASAAPAAGGIPAVAYFQLTPEGDVWVCECEGRTFRLRDSRGMQMLARLVSDAGREYHVLDLMGADRAEEAVDGGDAGEALDDRARRDYRRQLECLREQLEDAESRHDLAAADAAREEIEMLTAELSRAFGLGGKARRTGSNVERARVNVQRRLKHAIERIDAECPAAGKHLRWAIRTGTYCSYQPG